MTAFLLKIIASITMLLDHTQVVFPSVFPFYLRYIGRIAFPVYAYMIAQGCRRTRNIGKYLFRLGIFALVSEIPFDLAFRKEINFLSDTNIFYTLFLGTACIAIYKKLREKFAVSESASVIESENETEQKPGQKAEHAAGHKAEQKTEPPIDKKNRLPLIVLSVLLMTPVAILANLLGTDYGALGIICILIFYFAKPENRLSRTIAAFCVVFYMYGFDIVRWISQSYSGAANVQRTLMEMISSVPAYMLNFFLFALFAVLLICLYNGKLGPRLKWAFYIFYPAHLLILVAIKYLQQ